MTQDIAKAGTAQAGCASAISVGEFLSIVALVQQHERGEDLTETLRRLLALQESKRALNVSQGEMLSALRNHRVEDLRGGVVAMFRVRRFLREAMRAR